MTFGKKILNLRKQLNLTQKDVASKLNVSRQAVAKWESDIGLPDLDNIKKLSTIFNTSIDELLDYKIEDVNFNIDSAEELIGKENSKFNKVDEFMQNRFSKANSIIRLTRVVHLSVWQKIFDFFVGAGTLEVADLLGTGIVYSFLVLDDSCEYLILISKGKMYSKKLTENFVGKKQIIDGYKYYKVDNLK